MHTQSQSTRRATAPLSQLTSQRRENRPTNFGAPTTPTCHQESHTLTAYGELHQEHLTPRRNSITRPPNHRRRSSGRVPQVTKENAAPAPPPEENIDTMRVRYIPTFPYIVYETVSGKSTKNIPNSVVSRAPQPPFARLRVN